MKHFANISGSLVIEQVASLTYPSRQGNWVEHTFPHVNKGFTYDEELGVFYPPQPYPSFVLDKTTQMWDPPIPYPNDGNIYSWDESTTSWELI